MGKFKITSSKLAWGLDVLPQCICAVLDFNAQATLLWKITEQCCSQADSICRNGHTRTQAKQKTLATHSDRNLYPSQGCLQLQLMPRGATSLWAKVRYWLKASWSGQGVRLKCWLGGHSINYFSGQGRDRRVNVKKEGLGGCQ